MENKVNADLAARVQHVLLNDCLLDPTLPLVVGVSGGADSLALLTLLVRLDWQVHVAHFDHHLRPEAGADARFVRAYAERCAAPFWLGEEDVAGLAQSSRLSIEEAARQARYAFLFSCARRVLAQAVLVAHTASDQVETVLMHLLRGAGLSGLRGMAPRSFQEGWDSRIPLARPLLGIWRDEIEDFCRENQLEPLQDASNTDPAYFRNRLRHELIPYLESYNPRIQPVLLRTAAVLAGDWAVLDSALDQVWGQCWQGGGDGYSFFSLPALRELPPGLLRGVLRRAAAGLRPGLRDIDFDDIERAAAFVARPPRTARMDWVSGLGLFLEEGLLYLEEPGKAPLLPLWPQLSREESLLWASPGRIELANGWYLESEISTRLPPAISQADPDHVWLDGGSCQPGLEVRPAVPGERFAPLGMGGRSQKLSDLWVNLAVPRRARKLWPLVCAAGQVAWIPGLRVSERFRVRPDSQAVLHLHLVRQPPLKSAE